MLAAQNYWSWYEWEVCWNNLGSVECFKNNTLSNLIHTDQVKNVSTNTLSHLIHTDQVKDVLQITLYLIEYI